MFYNNINNFKIIKEYQVCFYDEDLGDNCFDETFYAPEDADVAMTYVETDNGMWDNIRKRVFVHFTDGDVYELNFKKVNEGNK